MLGADLLIAPAPEPESPYPYTIGLPGADWYDYWTGLPMAASRHEETPQIDRLPVFVRPGAIIPRQPLVQSTRQTPQGPLELSVYPGPNCRGQLYLDDGVSFAYQTGAYLRQTIRCTVEADGTTIDFDAREGSYGPWWSRIELLIHGITAAPRRVLLGDTELPAATMRRAGDASNRPRRCCSGGARCTSRRDNPRRRAPVRDSARQCAAARHGAHRCQLDDASSRR